MGLNKNIKILTQKLEETSKLLDAATLYKSQQYDKMKPLLKNIQLQAKIEENIDDFGNTEYKVVYFLPSIVLKFDKDGQVIKDDLFYSVNMLDLLSPKAFDDIQKVLKKEKMKNMLK